THAGVAVPQIADSTLASNGGGVYLVSYVPSASPRIVRNLFEKNGYAAVYSTSSVVIEGNTLRANQQGIVIISSGASATEQVLDNLVQSTVSGPIEILNYGPD